MVTGKGVGGCLPPFSWGKTGPTAFLLGAGGNGKTRPDQKFFLEKIMAQLLLSARIRTVKKVDHVPPSSECFVCWDTKPMGSSIRRSGFGSVLSLRFVISTEPPLTSFPSPGPLLEQPCLPWPFSERTDSRYPLLAGLPECWLKLHAVPVV